MKGGRALSDALQRIRELEAENLELRLVRAPPQQQQQQPASPARNAASIPFIIDLSLESDGNASEASEESSVVSDDDDEASPCQNSGCRGAAAGPLIAPAGALTRSHGPVGCVGRVRSDLGGAPRPGRSSAAPPAKRIIF